MNLTGKSNNDNMTTMFMPDDLCVVINSYLKPSWTRFLVGINGKVKYFVEADYVKAMKYYDDGLSTLIDERGVGGVGFLFQEYINGEWKFSQKYEDFFERIGSCECCNVSGTVGRRCENKDAFCCEACGDIYCWDCENQGNFYNGDWYCQECHDDLTDEEED